MFGFGRKDESQPKEEPRVEHPVEDEVVYHLDDSGDMPVLYIECDVAGCTGVATHVYNGIMVCDDHS